VIGAVLGIVDTKSLKSRVAKLPDDLKDCDRDEIMSLYFIFKEIKLEVDKLHEHYYIATYYDMDDEGCEYYIRPIPKMGYSQAKIYANTTALKNCWHTSLKECSESKYNDICQLVDFSQTMKQLRFLKNRNSADFDSFDGFEKELQDRIATLKKKYGFTSYAIFIYD
jgi:hypothetical protein